MVLWINIPFGVCSCRGETGRSLSLWAQRTDISQAGVPCSAHLWVKGDEWEGESIALPDTYTHSLPLSPSLFLSLLYGFLTLYPLLFYCTTVKKTQGLCVFLPFLKKKLYLDKKSQLRYFPQLTTLLLGTGIF